jgi:hypothetical protein
MRALQRRMHGLREEALATWCDQMSLANALVSLHERVKRRYSMGLMSTCLFAWSVRWVHESAMRERGVDSFNVGYLRGEKARQRAFVAWAALSSERRQVSTVVGRMQWRPEAAKALAAWCYQTRRNRLQVRCRNYTKTWTCARKRSIQLEGQCLPVWLSEGAI